MRSLVLLAPDAIRDAANIQAETAGWGPSNLTRRLIDAQGAIWWGCRADASDADLARLANPATPEAAAVMELVVLDIAAGITGIDHWLAVLESRGLSDALEA